MQAAWIWVYRTGRTGSKRHALDPFASTRTSADFTAELPMNTKEPKLKQRTALIPQPFSAVIHLRPMWSFRADGFKCLALSSTPSCSQLGEELCNRLLKTFWEEEWDALYPKTVNTWDDEEFPNSVHNKIQQEGIHCISAAGKLTLLMRQYRSMFRGRGQLCSNLTEWAVWVWKVQNTNNELSKICSISGYRKTGMTLDVDVHCHLLLLPGTARGGFYCLIVCPFRPAFPSEYYQV